MIKNSNINKNSILGFRNYVVGSRKDNSTNSDLPLTFIEFSDDRNQIVLYKSNLSFNPSNGKLKAPFFVGDGSLLTNISASNPVIVNDTTSSDGRFFTFVNSTGQQDIKIANLSGLVYYPSTNAVAMNDGGRLSIGQWGFVSGNIPQGALQVISNNSTDTHTIGAVIIGQDVAGDVASISIVSDNVAKDGYIKFVYQSTGSVNYSGKILYNSGDETMEFYVNQRTDLNLKIEATKTIFQNSNIAKIQLKDLAGGTDKKNMYWNFNNGSFELARETDAGGSFSYPLQFTAYTATNLLMEYFYLRSNAYVFKKEDDSSIYAQILHDATTPYLQVGNSDPLIKVAQDEIKFVDVGAAHFSIFNKSSLFQINNTSTSTNLGTVGTNVLTINTSNHVSTATNSYLGIGITPTKPLDVYSNTYVAAFIRQSSLLPSNSSNYINITNANNFQMLIGTDGVGFTGNTDRANVGSWSNAHLCFYTSGIIRGSFNHTDGKFYANVVNVSDDRLKENETPIINGISTINKLKSVFYDKKNILFMKDLNDDTEIIQESGYIAQDVYKIPELAHTVSVPSTENDVWAINYVELLPYHTVAIQELTIENVSLKEEIELLKKDINLIKQHLNLT